MSAQIVLQHFRFRRNRPEPERSGVLRPFRDRLAEFFLGRLAEAGQLRHPAGGAGFLELRDRADLAVVRTTP